MSGRATVRTGLGPPAFLSRATGRRHRRGHTVRTAMITTMLQVCLNGARQRTECELLPVTPQELGDAAAEAVAAGARAVHIHPKDADGADTMAAVHVDAAVAAVRASAPGVPIGVTTGEWTEPDPRRRAALVHSWSVLPDHASVNWHEDGAESGRHGAAGDGRRDRGGPVLRYGRGRPAAGLAARLPGAAGAGRGHRHRPGHGARARRSGCWPNWPRWTAWRRPPGRPVLLHGEEGGAWPVLQVAAARGLDAQDRP